MGGALSRRGVLLGFGDPYTSLCRRPDGSETRSGRRGSWWPRGLCHPLRLWLSPRLPMVASTCKRGSNLEGENLRKLPPGGLGHVGRGTCCQQVSSEAGRARPLSPPPPRRGPRCERCWVSAERVCLVCTFVIKKKMNDGLGRTTPHRAGGRLHVGPAAGSVPRLLPAARPTPSASPARTLPLSLTNTHNALVTPPPTLPEPRPAAATARHTHAVRMSPSRPVAADSGYDPCPVRETSPTCAACATGAHPQPPAALPTF